MNYRKFCKNLKAISPIISVLLMIAIAVVASLVVYAWVMGYIGYQTGKTGDSVVIQSVSWAPDTAPAGGVAGTYPTAIYLQNIGSTTVTVVYGQSLYVQGALDPTATINAGIPAGNAGTVNVNLISGTTLKIVPTSIANIATGTTLTIKVTTLGGTYSQENIQVP